MIRNAIEYLERTAELYPDKIALIEKEKSYTYYEISKKSKALATVIQKNLGGEINQPIAVYMRKSIDCLISFFGVLYSGNFYTPIDVNMPMERARRIVDVLQPAVVIYKDEIPENLEVSGVTISLNQIENVETDYEAWNSYRRVLDIDPIYTLFTSGSTGQPKGVVISHKGVIDYTEWLADTFAFDEKTVFGNQAPFYFDNSVLDIYSTIRNGATLVILPDDFYDAPDRLTDFMNEKGVNTIFWVPSALIGMANARLFPEFKLEGLKNILFCGEVMPNKALNVWRKKCPNALYANLYGPTEITDVCTYYIVDREFEDNEPLPIGKACRNTEILVLNEQDERTEIEEVGELCVRGTGLSMGYYGDPERTEKVFVQNPTNHKYIEYIYRTGDLVKINDKNEIIYIGRKDFQIKLKGYRIELGEIEAAINAIDLIESSCCIFDEVREQIICIYTGEIERKEIRAAIKKWLPRYMMPHRYVRLDNMPLNVNGKIDRVLLKKQYGA